MVKHRRGKVSASPNAERTPADVQTVVQRGLKDNPEVRLVLEIAARARELEAATPPLYLDTANDIRANSSISQAPVI